MNLDPGCKPHYAFCLSSKRLERLGKLAKNKKVFKKRTEAITAGCRINDLFNGGLAVLAYSLDFGLPALIARKYLPLTFYLTFSFDNWVGVNIFGHKTALML